MPTLHNPAENSLFCHRLGRILGIDERVEITDEEAADLQGGPIFVVEESEEADSKPRAKRPAKKDDTAEDSGK